MESLYSALSADIEVIYKEDHTPTYNGYPTVDQALMNMSEIYRRLTFFDRMQVSAEIANRLTPVIEEVSESIAPGRRFIYTYVWDQIHEDYSCMVFDASTGSTVFDEWFKILNQHQVMTTVEDVDGLFEFLLHHGELLEGDQITFQFRGRSSDGDDSTLQT